MFERSESWKVLSYKERLILMVIMMELSQAPGTKEIDGKIVRKESCMSEHDYTMTVQSLLQKQMIDVNASGDKLLLIGDAQRLFEKEVLKRRGQ